MVLDPRAKRLLDVMSLSAPAGGGRMTTAARREGFAKLMAMGARSAPVAQVTDMALPGSAATLPVRVYAPLAGRDGASPALVFLHGGGLVAGSIDTHDAICRRLANASGAKVFSVGYRLAPEAKFPAGLADAADAFDRIAAEAEALGIDPQRMALAGESAGALLAALLCQGHHPMRHRPKAQLLLCPVVDLTGEFPSRDSFASGYLIDRAVVARDIEDCLQSGQAASDLPSPLRHGDPARSPPTVIVSAECDPFRDEAKAYADRLQAAGVAVLHHHHAGMVHSFYGLGALLPQADPALDAAGRALAAYLG